MNPSFKLWSRQAASLARHEITGVLFRQRSLPLYILVGMPMLVSLLWAFFPDEGLNPTSVFAVFFFFILRFVVFFSCAGLFVHLFRGEILDRSLHYLLLLPMRREVLVVGKYLGGLAATILVLVPATAVMYLLFRFSEGFTKVVEHFTSGPGFGHLIAYLGIVVLGCVGYGAVFLAAGLIFKNPMIPATLFFLWEFLIRYLPPLLKGTTCIHYLVSLMPVPLPAEQFEFVTAPVSPWIAVPGLFGLALLMIALSAWKTRGLEVTYSAE